ncbi:alpha/beta hydrolase [Haladaptatus caseinilyticus]|uniref:alpha/beta hydrolase n=1 Tax=Haladaptatus caseinilyticus TaxID=2993314 RepID=UPI00224B5856|nr:alpha/beta hydrolase [Haladaptatus caseinilyticus]
MTKTPTRRRILQAVGAATAVSLAGCSSSGDGATETTSEAKNEPTTRGSTIEGGTTSRGTSTTDESTTSETETDETTGGTNPPKGGGDVKFRTNGGATVRGTLLGEGPCGVVFAHGVGFDRKSWLPQARKLAEEGYTCLTIDLNLDDRSTTPEYVLAAVRYLRRRVGVKNVVLIGASAGANAVVRANSRAGSGTIDGTLAISPGKATESASGMQGWKLFVVSRGDKDRFVRTTKQMHENAPSPKRFEKISGSAHGQHAFEENDYAMRSLMNELLNTVCGGE